VSKSSSRSARRAPPRHAHRGPISRRTQFRRFDRGRGRDYV